MEKRATFLLWFSVVLMTTTTTVTARLHPSGAHHKSHRKKSNPLLPKYYSTTSTTAVPTSTTAAPTSTTTLPATSSTLESFAFTESRRPTSLPFRNISTTDGITFQIGNHTINNLENTLDDITPNNKTTNTELADISYTTNPFVNDVQQFQENDVRTQMTSEITPTKNSTSNVILEVINIAPYFKKGGRSRYSKRFAMIVSLYATLAFLCVVMTVCLIRGITMRNKRHRQYVLLTKRDLEFPLGGGGI